MDLFLFYVLCECDERGAHIVGYFSKVLVNCYRYHYCNNCDSYASSHCWQLWSATLCNLQAVNRAFNDLVQSCIGMVPKRLCAAKSVMITLDAGCWLLDRRRRR